MELHQEVSGDCWYWISLKNDTGRLLEFIIDLCVEGGIELNSDNDSFIDSEDNCPLTTNEDQSDIDNNGIGDVCDIFSEQNISIT